MSEYGIKKPATLKEQVVEAILHDLQAGIISPGERVTEEGLAKRLNVSRTPIREAIFQLTHQGSLQARPGGGYVVPFPTPAEIRDIIAVRKLLEPHAVRLAAEQFGRDQVEAISRAIDREASSVSAKNATKFAKANEEFREAIFQSISNKALSSAIAQFNTHLHLIRSSTLASVELRRDIVDSQLAIKDAIQAHDAELAASLWIKYLDMAERALLAAVVNWAPDGAPKAPRRNASAKAE